jgi:hypothetical protein
MSDWLHTPGTVLPTDDERRLVVDQRVRDVDEDTRYYVLENHGSEYLEDQYFIGSTTMMEKAVLENRWSKDDVDPDEEPLQEFDSFKPLSEQLHLIDDEKLEELEAELDEESFEELKEKLEQEESEG